MASPPPSSRRRRSPTARTSPLPAPGSHANASNSAGPIPRVVDVVHAWPRWRQAGSGPSVRSPCETTPCPVRPQSSRSISRRCPRRNCQQCPTWPATPGAHAVYAFQMRQWFARCETSRLDPLVGIQRAHVELYIRGLSHRGLMDSSVNTMTHAVRGYFRFAHIDGVMGPDPAIYARPPKVHPDESRSQGLERLELIQVLQVAQTITVHQGESRSYPTAHQPAHPEAHRDHQRPERRGSAYLASSPSQQQLGPAKMLLHVAAGWPADTVDDPARTRRHAGKSTANRSPEHAGVTSAGRAPGPRRGWRSAVPHLWRSPEPAATAPGWWGCVPGRRTAPDRS